ncbi:MAG: LrgB family protein [Firmicutes bacterium]|nr:LrgB family protein [Bacillota bacterium]
MADLTAVLVEIANLRTFGVAITLGAFFLARRVHELYPSPLTHPLLISSIGIMVLLELSGVDYAAYNQGGRLISLFLGPATVALGVPLYRQTREIGRHRCLILVSVAAGAISAMLMAASIVKLLGGDSGLVFSMLPKSVTTPIAMEISRIIGGVPALTSVFVVISGLLGAMFGPELLRAFGVRDPKAIGLALGTAAHGIGTGRALQEGERVGAYSGLAIGLAGLFTAVLAPIVAALIRKF